MDPSEVWVGGSQATPAGDTANGDDSQWLSFACLCSARMLPFRSITSDGVDRSMTSLADHPRRVGGLKTYGNTALVVMMWDDEGDTGQSDYSGDETKLHLLNGFDLFTSRISMKKRRDLLHIIGRLSLLGRK